MRTLLLILTVVACGCDRSRSLDTAVSATSHAAAVNPTATQATTPRIQEVAPAKLASLQFDEYGLESAKLDGETLICRMSYGGGCADHLVSLVASRVAVAEGEVDLHLTHNANNDPCEAILTEDYQFSLADLLAQFRQPPAVGPDQTIALRIFTDRGRTPTKILRTSLAPIK